MSDPSFAAHIVEMTEIVRHFIRLKPRLRAVLPEDEHLARVKARLTELHSEGRSGSAADIGLILNVGVALAHQPEPMTMGDLSRTLDVPLSTATRIMDWLVRNDYARRLSDPEDRRVVRVTLTETGQAMYRAANEFIQKRVERVLHPFTPEERGQLIKLLGKLVTALEEQG